jgi:lysozyme family protein
MLNPAYAKQALAAANGDPNQFFSEFKKTLMGLDKWQKYGNGWSNRIDRAQAMANGTEPVSTPSGGGGGDLSTAKITPKNPKPRLAVGLVAGISLSR